MRRLLFACSLVVFSVGCFGRTGIGLDDLTTVDDDAATDSGVVIVEGGTDSSVNDTSTVTDSAGEDRFIDIWDVIPIPDGGPIGECAGCVRDKCGTQVNQCVNSPACRSGLACVATKCLAGGGGGGTGGFDLACVNDCFGGDFKTASLAISTFTCVISGCGSKCGSFLGGLGSGIPGLPGSGFAGSFMTPEEAAKLPMSTRFSFSIEAFAPWRKELDESACEQGLASCPR